MTDTLRNRRRPAIAALLLLVIALAIASCGGGSSSSSKTTATAASKTRGAFAARFQQLRACMQKNGVTLPEPTPGKGQRPSGGGFFGGGAGVKLPAGVTQAQYEAALKKCAPAGGFRRGGGTNVNTPAARAALAKFATCMRENGVDVPAPNTSGKGPVFNTKGLDTTSEKFKTAQTKCASTIRGVFPARPGGAGGAPPGGAPPAGGAAPEGGVPPAGGAVPAEPPTSG